MTAYISRAVGSSGCSVCASSERRKAASNSPRSRAAFASSTFVDVTSPGTKGAVHLRLPHASSLAKLHVPPVHRRPDARRGRVRPRRVPWGGPYGATGSLPAFPVRRPPRIRRTAFGNPPFPRAGGDPSRCRLRDFARCGPRSSGEIARGSVDSPQELLRRFVVRVHAEGGEERLARLLPHSFLQVNPREVRVRVEVAAVPRRGDRLLEPRDRVIQAVQLDQVRADVVVRISERRVDRDRPLALLDRVVVPAHEAECPCMESVGLSGRSEPNRTLVCVGRAFEFPGTLEDVGGLKRTPCSVLARL